MKPHDSDRTFELWTRALHGERLVGVDAQQLLSALEQPDGPWRELVEDRRLDGVLRVLHDVAQESEQERFTASVLARQDLENDSEQFVPRVQRRLDEATRASVPPPRSRRDLVLAFTAGALCAAAVAFFIGRAGVTSEPGSLRGGVVVERAPGGTAPAAGAPGNATRAAGATPAPRSDQAEPFTGAAPAPGAGAEVQGDPQPPDSADAVLAEVRGPVVIAAGNGARRRARIGSPLGLQDTVITDPRSGAVVRFADGSRLELGRSTELRALGNAPAEPGAAAQRRIIMDRGSLTASVTPTTASNVATTFVTPRAIVKVVGTELALRVSPEATRVLVDHGVVRVGRGDGGTDLELHARQWTIAGTARGPVVQAIRGEILFITADRVLNEGEEQMRDRMENLGWLVALRQHGEVTAQDGQGKALVVISNTTESSELDLGFRDLAVPLLVCEPWFFDELGMTWAGDGNRHMNQTSLLVHSTHPLAAGFSGPVRVSHAAFSLVWGRPGPGAQWVASAVDNASLAPIFGYERGAAMQGTVAPARRVGFFLAEDTAATLTEAGWQLFDAAVAWSIGR